ncbi:hypothetical protein [Candidatus Bealeia paramacronuclearis]
MKNYASPNDNGNLQIWVNSKNKRPTISDLSRTLHRLESAKLPVGE